MPSTESGAGSNTQADDGYWLGFDLGGTKMLSVVYDQQFEMVARQRKKTKGFEGSESGVERIIGTMRQAIEEAGIELNQVRGIGIGCPGPVDTEKGVVIEAVNLSWKNVPLKDHIEQKLQIPTYVVNDVDGGVLGENRFGAAQGARSVIGIFPGTGIGGGCVYDGRIVSGTAISAWEIGHIRVVPDGMICGCGRRGCLETVASRLAIAAEVAKAAFRGEAPAIMDAVGTTVGDIRSGVLARAIENGDKIVEDIVRIAADHLGRAMADLTSLMVPDVFVLGGGLVEALPEIIVPTAEEAANRYVMSALKGTFTVKPAQLEDYATVLGVAAWAAQNVTGDQVTIPSTG